MACQPHANRRSTFNRPPPPSSKMPTSLPGTPPHLLAFRSSSIVSNPSGRQPHCQQHKELLRHSLVFVVSSPLLPSLPLCRAPFCSPHARFPITEMYVLSLSPSWYGTVALVSCHGLTDVTARQLTCFTSSFFSTVLCLIFPHPTPCVTTVHAASRYCFVL